MAKLFKYNKSKKQFNLNFSGTHFIYRKTRKEEIIEMDKWFVAEEPQENDAYITFVDNKGVLHKNEVIDTKNVKTYYNDPKNDNYGDYKSFLWEIPTKSGIINIQLYSGKCYLNSKLIESKKVSITLSKEN